MTPASEVKARKKGNSEINMKYYDDHKKETPSAMPQSENPFSGPKLHLFRKGQSKSS